METMLVSDYDFQLFKQFFFTDGQQIHIHTESLNVTYDSKRYLSNKFKDIFSLFFTASLSAYLGFMYMRFRPNEVKRE